MTTTHNYFTAVTRLQMIRVKLVDVYAFDIYI